MLKIIKKIGKPLNIIEIDDISTDAYFGVSMKKEDPSREYKDYEHCRGFISKREFSDGKYMILCPYQVTHGNGWDGWDDSSLENMLTRLVDSEKDVFQFNTFHELFTWVIQRRS